MKWNWQKHISSWILCFIAFTSYGQGLLMDYTFQNAPEVGVLIQNVAGFSRRAEIIRDSLHTRHVRFEIDIDGWSGSSNLYDLYIDSGLIAHVEIECDSSGAQPVPWIANLAGAATILDDILTTYPAIRIIVLDNEELNPSYHSGTIAEYLAIAEALAVVCRKRSVRMANGGFGSTFGITCFTFRYLKATYGQDTADAFGDRVFSTVGQYNAANNPGSNPSLEEFYLKVDSVVQSEAFDIINFHNYEPEPPLVVDPNTETAITPNVWRFISESLANGNPNKFRKVMSNEFGQRYNYEGDLMTGMLDISWTLGLLWIDRWSGNGTALGATPVTDDDGVMNDTGLALRAWNDVMFGIWLP